MIKKELINFVIVGVINTLFGYSLYALFIYLGLNYVFAILFSTILGILFNFKTIGKFVFHNNNNTLITKFFFVYLITFIVNLSIVFVFKKLGYNDYIAGFIALSISAPISFALMKYFVFNK